MILVWGASWHWEYTISSFALLVPTARLVWWWLKHQDVSTLDHLVYSYALGFYPVFVIASGVAYTAWLFVGVFVVGLLLVLSGGNGVIYWLWMIEVPRW